MNEGTIQQATDLVHRPLLATRGDLEKLRECLSRNNDRQRSIEALDWLYLQNTSGGQLFVDVAWSPSQNRVGAIYASLPGWFVVNGQRQPALQSLDTLTDADFRGRGLFTSLARSTYARASADGHVCVYGFPNANSAPGFFNKLDWSRLDPIPFLIRPLRARYFASKLKSLGQLRRYLPNFPIAAPWVPMLPSHRLVELVRFDERVTELWLAFRRSIRVAIDRDATYLDWRVLRKPDAQYRSLALETRTGELTALCIYTVVEKHGGRIAYIMDLLHRPEGTLAASLLLAHVVGEAARDGADAILAWAFAHSPNITSYRLNGFVPLPERLRPIELHFGARAFDESIAPLLRDRRSWYLSYLDADTV